MTLCRTVRLAMAPRVLGKLIIVLSLACLFGVRKGVAGESGDKWLGAGKKTDSAVNVVSVINIKASLKLVWKSIERARTEDPGLVKCEVVAHGGGRSTIIQTFAVPILGEISCRLALLELPPNEMDYSLIDSNMFKTFEGQWLLSAGANAHSSRLSLSCKSDLKKPVPQIILGLITAGRVKKRLNFIKMLAEKMEAGCEKSE